MSSEGPLAILGAGSYGSVLRELAEACGYEVIAFADDERQNDTIDGVPIVGSVEFALVNLATEVSVAVAVGNNAGRQRLLERARSAGFKTPSLISPKAFVSPSAAVADACYMHPLSMVWTASSLAAGCILSPHASVAHHSSIGPAAHLSAGAQVGSYVAVGSRVLCGMGATVSTGVQRIVADSVIGAGAVVVRDISTPGTYAGVPARMLRSM